MYYSSILYKHLYRSGGFSLSQIYDHRSHEFPHGKVMRSSGYATSYIYTQPADRPFLLRRQPSKASGGRVGNGVLDLTLAQYRRSYF